jgi:hypothetical protein
VTRSRVPVSLTVVRIRSFRDADNDARHIKHLHPASAFRSARSARSTSLAGHPHINTDATQSRDTRLVI